MPLMVRPSSSVSVKLPPVFVKPPRPAIWLAPLSVVTPVALPDNDDASIAPDPLSPSTPVSASVTLCPLAFSVPVIVRFSPSVSAKLPEVLVNAPSAAISLAPFSVVAPPALPVNVPESMVPEDSPIVPVSTSVTPWLETFSVPLMVRPSSSVKAKAPPVLENAASVAIWFAPLSVVALSALPVSVAALIAPAPLSLIVPFTPPVALADKSAVPVVVSEPVMRMLPPSVVSVSPPLPAPTAPLTVRDSSLVSANPPEPVFVKAPSAPTSLPPVSVAAPADEPVSVFASICPFPVSAIVSAECNAT